MFQIRNSYIFSNLQIFRIPKLHVFRIFRIEICLNFSNWKINKFPELFEFGKLKLAPKIGNFGIVYPFNIRIPRNFANSHICPLI